MSSVWKQSNKHRGFNLTHEILICLAISFRIIRYMPGSHNYGLLKSDNNASCFRMSLFENKTNDGDLGKLHADHNMNSPGDGKQHFPFASFPPFPFLPRIPVSHGDSMPTPLSLNLTGQIAGDSPRSAGSEDSPKSSPTGWWNFLFIVLAPIQAESKLLAFYQGFSLYNSLAKILITCFWISLDVLYIPN